MKRKKLAAAVAATALVIAPATGHAQAAARLSVAASARATSSLGDANRSHGGDAWWGWYLVIGLAAIATIVVIADDKPASP